MNKSIEQWSRLLVSLMAALLLFLSPPTASAHQAVGSMALADVPVGPYRLTTQVSPEVVRAGEVHFAAFVMDDGRPVVDCDVLIQVTPIDHQGPRLTAKTRLATVFHQAGHEAKFVLAEEGRYQVRIVVRDQGGNGGQAAFELEVHPSSAWVVVLVYSQLLIAPIIGLWLTQQAARAWFPQFLKIRMR